MSQIHKTEPRVKVGILSAPTIRFSLIGTFFADGKEITGDQMVVTTSEDRFEWNGNEYSELKFVPSEDSCRFELKDVVIGVNFHWQRKENQIFNGTLQFLFEKELTAVNVIGVEGYLASVISSEMSANASPALLKAHAVISRSWLLAQINKQKAIAENTEKYCAETVTDGEIIRWYDREEHVKFHVCADDHCQRYQGLTRQTTPQVQKAIDETRGLVLTDNEGKLCDARFSKSCGGVFEEFENCWEPVHHSYLEARRDLIDDRSFPDLCDEHNARRWILGRPDSFCNTSDTGILSHVLNDYDRETTDFYRWKVKYTNEELSELIKERSGIDFGKILALTPMTRGTSGRITRLRICGTKRTMIIGKELEIRKTLSKSHLYSSAFVVEQSKEGTNGEPEEFTLHGAGWGHGVGLCQIGAAVMGAKGYSFDAILNHYYPGAEITKLY